MATDIRTSELKDPIDVAEYLFRRLYEVGVRSVHGVPGDFNLVALDYVPEAGLNWVGNCNELNAGYAADGYARVKGISAVITTFGVGELSLLNAIGGAYSEYVPIVHIVGTPSTLSQRDGLLLHHTLGNGNFEVFADMSHNISCAKARLNDPHDAAMLIDNAIRECWVQSRPVYITLPTDMVQKKIEGERLKTPIDLSLPPNDVEKEDYVVDVVLKYLHAAKNPIILVDACAIRHRALKEVHELVEKSSLPVFVAPMGKGAVNETLPNYGGVYAGSGSNAGVAERVESSDLVLSIGAIKSDFNTAGFTYRVSQLSTIDFHSGYMRVRYSEYPGVHMHGVLRKVTAQLGKLNIQAGPTIDNEIAEKDQGMSQGEVITHDWLWPRVGQWLEPDDIVLTETGTANFGIWETKFPKGVTAISQVLWGSIGYSVGACQGAALAAKETGDRRTILFVGDGSFELTAQEVSTMIRHDLKPITFVICNEGYTIERYIHGMDAKYNDIQQWRYKDLVSVFGADPKRSKTYQVKTKQEAEDLFKDENFSSAPYLQFVELYMPKKDAPKALRLTAEVSAKTNAKHLSPKMEERKKRKSEAGNEDSAQKKPKQWRVPKKGQPNYVAPSIEPGDSGIWATCEMGKEGKSTAELRDLFEEYAKKLYSGPEEQVDGEDSKDDSDADIEAEIKKEVQGMKSKVTRKEALFQPVKMDVQCVLFFKTRPPIEPVSFVHTICKDAAGRNTQRARFVKRLSPMTTMGKATEDGLAKVADAVLGPVFHGDEDGLKFAIRPTRRNHNVMKRDDIIKQIARTVGPNHKVDLKGYDRLILVDVYRNILGMSVVGSDYDELKQYNLAELHDPSSKLEAKMSNVAGPETEGQGNSHPSIMAANRLGRKDDVVAPEKSEGDKTILDPPREADDAHSAPPKR